MEMFQEVAESQESKEENEDATVAADALEKLSVEGKKTEENAGEEAPAATKNEETKIDTDKKGEKPAPSTWGLICLFCHSLGSMMSSVVNHISCPFCGFLML